MRYFAKTQNERQQYKFTYTPVTKSTLVNSLLKIGFLNFEIGLWM